ncbi:unnamed protein product [Lupinus luteus]|uniref:Uncharacterized protein n=1 Tax=Lupinus luteus TaxID=3873 RepID=A0AAV1VY75_LUPLU
MSYYMPGRDNNEKESKALHSLLKTHIYSNQERLNDELRLVLQATYSSRELQEGNWNPMLTIMLKRQLHVKKLAGRLEALFPTGRRVESFADDLNTRRGIVTGRVALLSRSTEIQPLSLRFVPPTPLFSELRRTPHEGYPPSPRMGDEASRCKVRVPQAHDRDKVAYM